MERINIPAPLKIALIYLLISTFWIFFSDTISSLLFQDVEMYANVQKIKGVVFVLLTSLLIYILIRIYQKTIISKSNSLARSEERWQYALEGAGDGVWDWNVQTDEVYYSPQWKSMLGYGNDEIGNKLEVWENLIHPEDKERVSKELQDYLDGKSEYYQSQYKFRCKDGSYKWILDRGKIISRTDLGKPLRVVGTHKDINKDKLLELELETTQYGIDNAEICVYRIEEDGTIIYANKKASECLGYTKKELIGKSLFDIDPNFNHEKFIEHRKIVAHERSRTIQSTQRRKDGSEFPVEVTVNYFQFRGKNLSFSFVKDITEREKFINDLVQAKEKAEKADKLKTEFFAQMSHEIRSPLNAIINLNEIVKEEVKSINSEDLVIAFKGIESSSKRIIRTVDLILNTSELQLGLYQSTKAKIDLTKLLRNLVSDFKSSSAREKLSINYDSELDQAEIFVDDYAVTQIFTNLIDNAVKYTPEGYVKVILKSLYNDKYLIEIKDSGIGISEKYLTDLFKPFSQEEQGYSRRYEGNGLGLSLVKRYCKIIGAEIEVESEKGSGSLFRVIVNKSNDKKLES